MASSALARRDAAVGYTMVAPAVLGALAFVVAPLVAVVWYSLHEWNVLANTFTFAGADNYERMLADPGLRDSLLASLWFSVGLVVLNISLALVLAVLLNQRLPGTTTFRTFFFSPVVVSSWRGRSCGASCSRPTADQRVPVAARRRRPELAARETTAMLSVIVVQVFKNVGLNMILFLAALQVPEEIQEAARIDGAGAWRRFRSITLRSSARPSCWSRSLPSWARSRCSRRSPCSRAGAGSSTTVLVYYLYQQAFRFNDFGYASAISVLLFVIVLVLTLVQWQTRKRWVFHEV